MLFPFPLHYSHSRSHYEPYGYSHSHGIPFPVGFATPMDAHLYRKHSLMHGLENASGRIAFSQNTMLSGTLTVRQPLQTEKKVDLEGCVAECLIVPPRYPGIVTGIYCYYVIRPVPLAGTRLQFHSSAASVSTLCSIQECY